MISIQSCSCPRRKRLSVASSVAFPSSSSPSKSESFKQSNRALGLKSPAAATNVPKYSKNDLQRIFKAVLEARTLALTFAPAPIISKVPRKKLKAFSPDVYCRKSHIDCYNFCQQCEDYFAIVGAMEPTQILFTTSFL